MMKINDDNLKFCKISLWNNETLWFIFNQRLELLRLRSNCELRLRSQLRTRQKL